MTTKLDTIMVLGPAPKEPDVDAPVPFPKEETEVVRKTDRAGCCTFRRFPVSRRDDGIVGSAVAIGGIALSSAVVGAMVLGGVFGGVTGILIGGGLTYPPAMAAATSGCVYAVCTKRGRSQYRPLIRITTGYAPEEAITEQPQSEYESTTSGSESVTFEPVSLSPEPEPATGGWLSFDGWFAGPSGETESEFRVKIH
ncbi:MAG: hypothetical protein OXF02_06505 [Simkaniaceae bacterium]|nr:hypothetical protein [Simkaniaceae bacterium]